MRWYVLKSFWYPIRDFADVIRIFWPAMLCFLLGQGVNVFASYLEYSKAAPDPALTEAIVWLSLGLVLYSGILFFMGVVRWHRKLVLDNRDFSLTFLPGMREMRYIGLVIGFFVLNIILFYFVVAVPYMAVQPLDLRETPALHDARQYVNHYSSVFTGVVLSFFLSFFLLLFFRRSVVMLPGVATEKDGVSMNMELLSEKIRGYKWSISILLVLFVPVFLMAAVRIGEVIFISSSPDIAADVMLKAITGRGFEGVLAFLTLYSGVSFATLLSLVYRDQIRPEMKAV